MNLSQEQKMNGLPKLQGRYARRSREGKSRMLDELCEDHNYERKYAIKLLSGGLPAASGRGPPGPERLYAVIEPVVQHLWLAAAQPCGKRLVPILRQWLPYYELRHGRLPPGRQSPNQAGMRPGSSRGEIRPPPLLRYRENLADAGRVSDGAVCAGLSLQSGGCVLA